MSLAESFLRHVLQPAYAALCEQALRWEHARPVWGLILFRASLDMLAEMYDETSSDVDPKVNSLIQDHVDYLLANIERLEGVVLRKE